MSDTTSQSRGSSLGIPVAIVIAAALIAGAIVFTGMERPSPTSLTGTTNNQQEGQVAPKGDVAPVTGDDHILGNPEAPIMVVEYSDYDCPYCKNFHETMHQIMTEFGGDGQVAWVYRHFPIVQLHPNAPKLAEASECVAELGGNDAFWEFSDLIFGERSVNAQTDMNALPSFAVQAGVDEQAYTSCVASGKYADDIQSDVQAAAAAGARGTPYSVILVGDEQIVINGAEQLSSVRQKIQAALSQLSN